MDETSPAWASLRFETIVTDVEVDGMKFDVRCFLVPHAAGVVLIDTGVPDTVELIAAGLNRLGADWSDVTDVVVTHRHFDHTANLREAAELAGGPAIWIGAEDRGDLPFEGAVRTMADGDKVRDLRALATPGHTAGHRSFIHDESGVLFAGDVAGTMAGTLTRGPQQFTADPEQAERTLLQLSTLPWQRMVLSHGGEVPDPHDDLRRLVGDGDGRTSA